MNKHLIIKEWKEKFWVPVFALAFLVLFAVAALAFAGRREFLDILTGAILIVFLPMTGVLLGASAFSSEFKDGAWAFLFSRPLKRSVIWISKFAALFVYLAAILLIYYFLLPLIPGFKERLIDISLWGLSLILSMSLFLVAFSLSFLSEKQFQVVFISLLVFAGFGALPAGILKIAPFFVLDVPLLIFRIWMMISAAIGAASLVAFCRADFSQPKAKVFGFLKAFSLFLVLTVIIGSAIFTIGGRLQRLSFLFLETDGHAVYPNTSRGIYRYDADRDKLIKVSGADKFSPGLGLSVGGGKIVWLKASIVRKKRIPESAQELWIMDSDGRNKRAILKTAVNLDSSLYGYGLAGSSLSRDGRRILLVSWPGKNQENRIVWSLNSDGSGLKKHPIGVPNAGWISCLGWTPDNRQAVILINENHRKGETARPTPRIFRFSPDSGVWQALGDNMMGIHLFGMSPAGNRLGYFGLDSSDPKAPRDILRYIDVETTIETDILSIPGLQQARWNLEGDQVAFLADHGRRIGIVSVAEKSVLAERSLEVSKTDRIPWTMDWADEGRKIVLSDFKDSRCVLRIFDKAFQNEKVYPLPIDKSLDNFPHVYGLGKKILVLDFSNSRLWSFDPAAEKWKKLF